MGARSPVTVARTVPDSHRLPHTSAVSLSRGVESPAPADARTVTTDQTTAPRRPVRTLLGDAQLAFSFLTRLPVGTPAAVDGARMSRAAAWFPVVGLVVGGVVAATRLVAELALPAGPATVLALAAGILLTGGFHEDGLADVADGVGAHVSRERKLEILRDSRVGTYGALAIALPLLFAYACLTPLDGSQFAAAVVCAHALGRWSVLPHSLLARPARATGSGTLVRARTGGLIAASAVASAAAAAAFGLAGGVLALTVATGVTVGAGLALARVVGGVTGDSYGAVNKLVELATYGVAVALATA